MRAAVLALVACTAPQPRVRVEPDRPPPEAGAVAAATAGVTACTLSFPEPHTQYMDVACVYPASDHALEVWMATWTPGSYLVREYARDVEGLAASTADGSPLTAEKISKNRWKIEATDGPVSVRYRVWCHELNVRGNWVEPAFAMLNGAPTFLVVGDGAFDVTIVPAEGWTQVRTALDPHPDGAANRFLASDLDTLLDSPIVIGDPAVYEWQIEGVPHFLVNLGEGPTWDGPKSAADVEKISREQAAFWGVVPYRQYLFLNVIAEAGGGLEHKESTLTLTGRWTTRLRDDYTGWLGLMSHEFFHTWNVKRLRPKPLGPFDYENEVYTKSLWLSEGVTSYYDDVTLVRAGLITEGEYLDRLSKTIADVQATPGRFVRSLEDASFDAWIKLYRSDANTKNTSVNYYSKGSLVGWLLDARIRVASKGSASLDDAMRLAYSRFSGESGFTPEDFVAVCTEVAGVDLDPWFAKYVRGVDELDYREALVLWGLEFADSSEEDEDEKEAKKPKDPEPAWLGLSAENRGGQLRVTHLERDAPAWDAGFLLDDEILAIDGLRVPPGGWEDRLKRYRGGDEATVLVARREALVEVKVTFWEAAPDPWKLKIDDGATPKARDARAAWLEAVRR